MRRFYVLIKRLCEKMRRFYVLIKRLCEKIRRFYILISYHIYISTHDVSI